MYSLKIQIYNLICFIPKQASIQACCMEVQNAKNDITLRHDQINNFPVNLFMARMVLIGKFYNTFYNIVTTDLISVYKKQYFV